MANKEIKVKKYNYHRITIYDSNKEITNLISEINQLLTTRKTQTSIVREALHEKLELLKVANASRD